MKDRVAIYIETTAGKCKSITGGCHTGLSEKESTTIRKKWERQTKRPWKQWWTKDNYLKRKEQVDKVFEKDERKQQE